MTEVDLAARVSVFMTVVLTAKPWESSVRFMMARMEITMG